MLGIARLAFQKSGNATIPAGHQEGVPHLVGSAASNRDILTSSEASASDLIVTSQFELCAPVGGLDTQEKRGVSTRSACPPTRVWRAAGLFGGDAAANLGAASPNGLTARWRTTKRLCDAGARGCSISPFRAAKMEIPVQVRWAPGRVSYASDPRRSGSL